VPRGEHAAHLKHRATAWRGRIDPPLMQIQLAANGLQFAQQADQMLHAAALPVD